MTRAVSRHPARYGLPDTEAVQRDLRAVGIAERPADPASADSDATVLAALSRAGRPDLALAGLARLSDAADDRAELDEALRRLPRFRARLLGVLGGSLGLADHLQAFPADWHLLVPETDTIGEQIDADTVRADLLRSVGADPAADRCTGTAGGRAALTGPAAVRALRRAYRAQLLVIAAHDLAPAVEATLPVVGLLSVCQSLSTLADATLQTGLAVAAAGLAPGAPDVRLGVVAMGKCGANELNYVSDVDVVFVAEPGRPGDPTDRPDRPDDAAALATATGLASRLMAVCGAAAWEVDAALRPEGKAGALVRTLASHRSYYQRWAQTWEFQALLKARPAAGDLEVAGSFTTATAAGVWSAAERPSFVDDVQAMRRRVETLIPDRHRDIELKLGAGGLRDVEFAVQLLQLVHGRGDEELRLPGTLMALRALVRGGYVGRADGAELAGAYTFLRRAEHRLQLQRLRRTHLLPADPADRNWLARTEGYAASGAQSAADVFESDRTQHATTVRRLHEKLFYRPLLRAVAAVPGEELRLTPEAAASRLSALGFAQPDAAVRHLAALTSGVSRRAAVQRALLPVLLDILARSPDPDSGLLGYRQVSDALSQTPWFLRLLRDEGLVAQRMAALLGGSKLVATLLVRAPEVLRLLVDDAALLAPQPGEVAAALLARAGRAADAVAAADAARSARRHEMLRLACGDLLGLIRTEDTAVGLTTVAEATLTAALRAATTQVTAGRAPLSRLAVIGMGRFGGRELGYGSDADVVYVAEPDSGADPQHALDEANAIADLLARLLGRPSPDPALLVDADLRPEGRNGRLVRTLAAYESYWQRFAAPWERQALLRARFVAGDAELGERFLAAADRFRYPAAGLEQSEVIEIRRIKARVDAERLPRGADPATHTKLGRGGLADVEWTIQLLQLQHAGRHPALRTTGTLPAIAAAVECGLLDRADAADLGAGWLAATRARNGLMLVLGRPADQLPPHGRPLAGVARALGQPADADPGRFVDEYRRVTRRARRVVDRVFDGR